MAVFQSNSQTRKISFRIIVVLLYLVVFIFASLFVFDLYLRKQTREIIPPSSLTENYHYYYSGANNKKIAITIDDGPRREVTEKILPILERNAVPATFFVIGQKAFVQPDVIAEVARRGFEIGAHSFTHQPDVHSSRSRLELEIKTTGRLIADIIGKEPKYYRPPFLLGIGIDPTVNPFIPLPEDIGWVLEQGYIPVGSDIDPRDWLATTTEGIMQGLELGLQHSPNGHILLLHEEHTTADILEEMIQKLKSDGYTFVSLDELLIPPKQITLTKNLRIGDSDKTTGGEVSKLQWFLYTKKYLDPYSLTGYFGSETSAALVRFQADQKLIDRQNVNPARAGIADKKTRETIASISDTTGNDDSQNLALLTGTNLGTTTGILTNILKEKSSEKGLGGALALYVEQTYVKFFPFIHASLNVIVIGTLILVLLRCGLLFSFILFGRKGTLPVQSDKERAEDIRGPGISVLIPAYNEEENIAATVESVIRSAYINKEIIVIDDGSRDKTAEAVREVIKANPKVAIRLIQVENGGKAKALNTGMRKSKHKIIAVLDADAVLHPDALFYFARHFRNNSIGAVAGKVCTTNSSNFLDICQTIEYAIGQNIEKRAFSALGAVGVVPGPAGAWNKKFLLSVGGFSTDTLVEDQDMTLTILRMGKRVVYESNAISYTETPHSVKNFLKQRFRWIYGTMQCFFKHKGIIVERPTSWMSLVVMPNTFIFNILLPLSYPLADSALIFGFLFGDWGSLILPFIILTLFDTLYAMIGVWEDKSARKLLWAVPLQRIVYRQLLYYTVIKSLIRAIEGTGSGWNKFTKAGETKRFYLSMLEANKTHGAGTQVIPEVVTTSFQGPGGISSPETNRHETFALSTMFKHSNIAGDKSIPAETPNVLVGFDADPNTYAKSSSPFGPTSSH